MDIKEAVTNPKLKELILEMKREQTDQNLNSVLEEVTMNANFLSVVIVSEQPNRKDENTATINDTIVQFLVIQSPDGKPFYPIFTDWEEVCKWHIEEKSQIIEMNFDDYYDILSSNENVEGLVINPFSENMVLLRDMLKLMRMQKDIIEKDISKNTTKKTTEVKLGEPKKYPTDMVNALCKHMKATKNINSAWLRMMKKEGELSYLIVVDFMGDPETVFAEIARIAKPHIEKIYIDMIPFDTDFGKSAANDVEPFYKKKKGLFSR